ncbi:hypothetical protein NP233_g2200 [Leucocoprinus birnbaumii]|uniref:Nephrocystin 3-like N-terminal domain-containing protein n=1 Tax=Leucocoprinus birnbaumii TaxID=56174 RepID=A0AAD5YYZ6_9AGAR|nr:hypothetical protein NP233_g2200 [Leucocoprinus birnbaumii]
MQYLPDFHDFQLDDASSTSLDRSHATVNGHAEYNGGIHKRSKSQHLDHADTINFLPLNEVDSRGSYGAGLFTLSTYALHGSSYDSSERYPPPLCHPGTRQEYIDLLTKWCNGATPQYPQRLAWMKGPAGVGKSSVAQTTAEVLGDVLGASFFFSRPNYRDDPSRFFTSLAYQLAVKYPEFGDFLDRKIYLDPTIVTKSLRYQFFELIVFPIRALKQEGKLLPEVAIFIDGLDECKGQGAQREIILLVAESLHDDDTPFRWIFFSRLEPHLVSTFNHPDIKSLVVEFELPISRELNPQIYLFLASRLKEVREKHALDQTWPSGKDLRTLVKFSSGHFACAHAIALYIEGTEDSASPTEHLGDVLQLASQTQADDEIEAPLDSPLDLIYTFILQHLSPENLQTTLLILLSTTLNFTSATQSMQTMTYVNLLNLPQDQFFTLCRSLYTVMKVDPDRLTFHHASFMDFLQDPTRSGRFCIWNSSPRLLRHVMQSLDDVRLDENHTPKPTLSWNLTPLTSSHLIQYRNLRDSFFQLLESLLIHEIQDNQTYDLVNHFDFRKLLLEGGGTVVDVNWSSPFKDLLARINASKLSSLIQQLALKNGFGIRRVLFRKVKYDTFTIGDANKSIILKVSTQKSSQKLNGAGSRVQALVYSEDAMQELKQKLIST